MLARILEAVELDLGLLPSISGNVRKDFVVLVERWRTRNRAQNNNPARQKRTGNY